MGWSAKRLAFLVGLCWVGTAGAQAPVVPDWLPEQAAQAVGAQWGVAPHQVELQWVQARGWEEVQPSDSLRITGRSDGWFVVLAPARSGRTPSARFRAGTQLRVPVAARSLERGDTLILEDYRLEERIRWGSPHQDEAVQEVQGGVLGRSVLAGTELRYPTVRFPSVLSAGASVWVRVERGNVTLRFRGTASHQARLGEPVRIRLEEGRGYVRGRVISSEEVVIHE